MKKFMISMLATASVLLTSAAFGQNSCATAVSITPHGDCQPQSFTPASGQLEYWFTFKADSSYAKVIFEFTTTPASSEPVTLTLYGTDNCSGATIISQASGLPNVSTGSYSLSPDHYYFVKASMSKGPMLPFNLCVIGKKTPTYKAIEMKSSCAPIEELCNNESRTSQYTFTATGNSVKIKVSPSTLNNPDAQIATITLYKGTPGNLIMLKHAAGDSLIYDSLTTGDNYYVKLQFDVGGYFEICVTRNRDLIFLPVDYQDCGLNYAAGSVQLNQRSSDVPFPHSTGTTNTITISGIPPNATIVKALLWMTIVGGGVSTWPPAPVCTIVNPTGISYSATAVNYGYSNPCWGTLTRSLNEADVTSAIDPTNVNGVYTLSGYPSDATIPHNGNQNSTGDTDGATLFIIYKMQCDETQHYGYISINYVSDSNSGLAAGLPYLIETAYTIPSQPISDFNIKKFVAISDLEYSGTSITINNSSYIMNPKFWNFEENNIIPSSAFNWNEPIITTSILSDECWSVGITGIYFQDTTFHCYQNPSITAVASPAEICQGESVTLSAINPSGGTIAYQYGYNTPIYPLYSYFWTDNPSSMTSISNAPSFVVTPSVTTTYTVYMMETNSTCLTSSQVVVTVYPNPDVTVTPVNSSICSGSSVTLTASGAANYNWSTGETGSSITVSPVVTTTYTVTGTNAICSGTAQAVVNVSTTIQPFTIIGESEICEPFVGNYSLSNTQPGVTYTWTISPCTSGCTFTGNSLFINWNSYNISSVLAFTLTVYATNGVCSYQTSMPITMCCLKPNVLSLYNTDLSTIPPYNELILHGSGNFVNSPPSANLIVHDRVFYLGTNAKITIYSGAKVTFNNCVFQACDGYMWDGIYLTDATSELEMNNCRVIDAKNAVVSNSGGKYTLNKTTFKNDYKGVVVNSYSTAAHTGIIKGCDFLTAGSILPQVPAVVATRGKCGVEVNNVMTLNIGGSGAVNTFKNLDMGIYTKNSYVVIKKNQFRNISFLTATPISQMKGVAIYSINPKTSIFPMGLIVGGYNNNETNDFNNCLVGVYSFNNQVIQISKNTFSTSTPTMATTTAIWMDELWHSPTQYKVVDYNTIKDYNNGITANNMQKVNIQYNDIRKLSIPWPAGSTSRAFGVKLTNGSWNTVYYNNIENPGGGYPDWRIQGVFADMSNNANVQCNEIKNMGNAIRFDNYGAPATVATNKMKGCTVGLVLAYSEIGDQGSIGHPSDNEWISTGPYSFYEGHTYTWYCDGNNSKLYVRNTTGSSYNPLPWNESVQPYVWSGNYWKIERIFTYGQGGLCLYANPLKVAKSFAYKIAKDSLNSYLYPSSAKHGNKVGLYNYLLTDSIVNTDSILRNFVNQQQAANPGHIHRRDSLLTRWNLPLAAAENNMITADNLNAQYDQSILGFVLDQLQTQNEFAPALLNSNIIDSLRFLAQQCPAEYGSGVHYARMILRWVDTTHYHNPCEFLGPDNANNKVLAQVTEINENGNTLTVFPNPANNEVTFQLEQVEEMDVNIEVYNQLGAKTGSVNIPTGALNVLMPLDKFSAGIYYCKAGTGEAINNKTIKLVIIK